MLGGYRRAGQRDEQDGPMVVVGVLGLVVGLWMALSGPPGHLARGAGRGRREATAVVGYVLVALSVVLVLTSTFPANLTRTEPSNCKLATYCAEPSPH